MPPSPSWRTGDADARLSNKFRELGFHFITLDLEGFRSGSLNSLVSLEMKRLWDGPGETKKTSAG